MRYKFSLFSGGGRLSGYFVGVLIVGRVYGFWLNFNGLKLVECFIICKVRCISSRIKMKVCSFMWVLFIFIYDEKVGVVHKTGYFLCRWRMVNSYFRICNIFSAVKVDWIEFPRKRCELTFRLFLFYFRNVNIIFSNSCNNFTNYIVNIHSYYYGKSIER